MQQHTILITGAGEGIGAAITQCFATHGATVILADKPVAQFEKIYDQIEPTGHPQPVLYPIDFCGASADDYLDLTSTLEENFGFLHGLLHNTAQLGIMTPLKSYPAQTWVKTLHTNLTAPFLICTCI